MKAVVVEEPGGRVTLKDIPVPEIEDDELLVRVKACGICQSDLLMMRGDFKGITYSLIPRHEFSGEVVQVR